MSTNESMNYLVDLLLEDRDDEVDGFLLTEAEEEQVVRSLGGEVTLMNYLLKFEEYLDNHDIYLFDGWEKAKVIKAPQIDKFWTTFYLHVSPTTDLRGAMRLLNDKEGQNQIKRKKLDDGSSILKFKILKRNLDQIEKDNQERSNQLSTDEMEKF